MSKVSCLVSMLWLMMCAHAADAQSGTYQKRDNSGASCTIAISKTSNKLKAAAFAWWGTPSGTNGNLKGSGILKDNVCIIKSADDAGCSLTLTMGNHKIKATFSDCIASNLPEDFSGSYDLLTTALPGVYMVKSDRSYFYKNTLIKSRLKTYLVKGDKTEATLENIKSQEWLYVNYRNPAGRLTSGYMRLSELQLVKPSM
jgi:hypothetical protein